MNEPLVYVLLALTAGLTLAILILLLRQNRNRDGEALTRAVDDAADDLRRDLFQQNEALRAAVTKSLDASAEKTDRLAERTYAGQLQTTRALAEMQEKSSENGRAQTAAVTAAVEKLQRSNEQKLEEMRATVDEKLTGTLNARLDASFRTVSEQLMNVHKSLGEMRELSGGITALNRVLAGVKTRGSWAEGQLAAILDQIVPGMYEVNYRPEAGREAVEFAVRVPAEDGSAVYLPIDSKFPTEDYLRLCDAADTGDAELVKQCRRALEARVLAQAREIRKYICPPETTNFAVMYLATDSLYAEIVSSRDNLADRIHTEYGVLIAGPSTVTALLSALAMGFRTVALNKKAGEVMDLLAAARTQYDKFGAALERAKKKIEDAGKSLDEAQDRNRLIVKKLRGVESLAPEEAERLLAQANTESDE